jgi:hypothetical protein
LEANYIVYRPQEQLFIFWQKIATLRQKKDASVSKGFFEKSPPNFP